MRQLLSRTPYDTRRRRTVKATENSGSPVAFVLFFIPLSTAFTAVCNQKRTRGEAGISSATLEERVCSRPTRA